jgi:PAS domain S-box-containing protein
MPTPLRSATKRDSTAPSRTPLEDALDREQLLEVAQQVANVGSWYWNVSGRHVHWSPELWRIFGLELGVGELTLEHFLSLVHPDDRATVANHFAHVVEHGTAFSCDHRITRPDGEIRHVHLRGHVYAPAREQALVIVGSGQDITDRKLRE